MKWFKRAAALLSVLLLVGSAYAAEGTLHNFKAERVYVPFSDVPSAAWYAENVRLAYEYGLIEGVSEDSYSPSGRVTAAEAVVLAARLRSIYYGGTGDFALGVPWYAPAVEYAVEQELLDEGRFADYRAPITRAEFARLLAAALPENALPAINVVSTLPDVSDEAAYAKAVYLLYRAGILTGSDAHGAFRPDSTLLRSEVAAIMVRMANAERRCALTDDHTVCAIDRATNRLFDYQVGDQTVTLCEDCTAALTRAADAYFSVLSEGTAETCGLYDVTGDGLPELFLAGGVNIVSLPREAEAPWELLYSIDPTDYFYHPESRMLIAAYEGDSLFEAFTAQEGRLVDADAPDTLEEAAAGAIRLEIDLPVPADAEALLNELLTCIAG